MKYLAIMIALLGCSSDDHDHKQQERIKKEAIEFCGCHEGVDTFVSTSTRIDITCKDGVKLSANDYLEYISVGGCGK